MPFFKNVVSNNYNSAIEVQPSIVPSDIDWLLIPNFYVSYLYRDLSDNQLTTIKSLKLNKMIPSVDVL